MRRTSLRHLGDDRVDSRPWRGRADIAMLSPVVPTSTPSPAVVERRLEQLRGEGVTTVVTTALAESEQDGFLEAGMAVRERLHLLRRDLDTWSAPTASVEPDTTRLRRARRRDRDVVLALDAEAFDRFWRFDHAALRDALTATPTSRFRVTGPELSAYAITGRSGSRGYLQRLAVHPAVQRRGIGTRLVGDGLQWLHRRGATTVLVNTQVGNDGALALYERLGFVRLPTGLAVLERRLAATA